MRASITDAQALKGLKPLEVVPYLKSKGWLQSSVLGDKSALWEKQAGDITEELWLPLRPELGDYALRMSEMLQTLERVEERSQLEILQDLITTSADLVRVRTAVLKATDGTIGFEDGVWLVERARDLMLAAACAAVDKRPYFATRRPEKANDYLRGLKMGQTERGSYVLTILSPVTPELHVTDAKSQIPDPYERIVTKTLMRALFAVRSAAQHALVNGDLKPFKQAVSDGVSANLCDALVGLARVSPTESIDLGISWARNRTPDASLPTKVTVSADVVPVIEEASRIFRETVTYDDFKMVGLVTQLDRHNNAERGSIVVSAAVENGMRNIHLELSEPEYTQAIEAHKERRIVFCVGELSKEGKYYRLDNARHFTVLPANVTEETSG
jgi:hypothetical protein